MSDVFSDISKEEVLIIRHFRCGRKLVFWGDKNVDRYAPLIGLQSADHIMWNKGKITSDTDHHFTWINGRKREIYVVVWNMERNSKSTEYFEKMGYAYRKDYLFIGDDVQSESLDDANTIVEMKGGHGTTGLNRY